MRAPSISSVVDPFGLLPRATRAATDVAADALERVLAGPELDRFVAIVLDSPAIGRITTQVTRSEQVEQAVAQLLQSHLFDATLQRVMESEEIWRIIEQIARSPAVTEAIAHQGAGFADQVAGEVAVRTRRADTSIETRARRLLHRPPPPAGAK